MLIPQAMERVVTSFLTITTLREAAEKDRKLKNGDVAL